MGKWITTFASAQRELKNGEGYAGRTVRLKTTVNLSGDTFRLRFGNFYGETPLRLGPVTVWNGKGMAEITFGGQPTLQLAPGSKIESDEAFLPVEAGDTLTVLFYFPAEALPPHSASGVFPVERSVPGDFTDQPDFEADPALMQIAPEFELPWPLPSLTAIDIFCRRDDAGAVAVLGDSITEMGFWTRPLTQYAAETFPGQLALLNLGIGGNRMLLPTSGNFAALSGNLFGEAAVTRLEWDILSIQGLKGVFLAMGVNDITQPGSNAFAPPLSERCTLEDLAAGFSRVQHTLHDRGIKVYVCTVTPFGGMGGFCPETLKLWEDFNAWLRRQAAAGEYDGLADFAKVVEDPQRWGYMLPAYDSGDHLHPSPEGGAAMAQEARQALNSLQEN